MINKQKTLKFQVNNQDLVQISLLGVVIAMQL